MTARAIILSICISIAASVAALSQSDSTVTTIVDRINASGHVKVAIPDSLVAKLKPVVAEASAETDVDENGNVSSQENHRAGYRVLVFDDNNPRSARHEALSRKYMVESKFTSMKAYVIFESPYWRVKVGDFRSRSEAEAALDELRRAFPGMSRHLRIVRDRINPIE